MARSDREPRPLYTVWQADADGAEDGRKYDAIDTSCAAAAHAAYVHRHQEGWEWTWPILFKVEDPDGKVWVVEVERELVPEFHGGKPLPAEMPPARHAIWGNEAICQDPRLANPIVWPSAQTSVTIRELFEGVVGIASLTCTRCRARAPRLIESLESIGALKRG